MKLYAASVPGGTNLSWAFPYAYGLTALGGLSVVLATSTVLGLFLQRSATATNMPRTDASIYEVSRSVPASDPNWTTIQTWTGPFFSLPTQFTDLTLPNPVFHYRLILIVQTT